eukprot:jgi/Tetstr1/457328/TSEL_043932.t1
MVAINFKSVMQEERQRRAVAAGGAAPPLASSVLEAAAAAALEAVSAASSLREPSEAGKLNQFAVARDTAEGLFYVPEFISPEEEAALVRFIDAEPTGRWVEAGERRMLNWGGRPGELAVREALPACIQGLVERMVAWDVYTPAHAPNHCLVNEYLLGGGIPPHQDGALYAPCVATITLEGPALMDFHQVSGEQEIGEPSAVGSAAAQVLLQPRGLLLMRGEAYTRLLHSIPSQRQDNITDLCSNLHHATGVSEGDTVLRAPKRKSLVFVHKLVRYT